MELQQEFCKKLEPIPFDLFSEYFHIEGLDCKRANIVDGLPVEDASSDYLICQEGIEHFSDQLASFKEFNRVLKKGGGLI